jgi:midasin
MRGRHNIVQEMTEKVTELLQNWKDASFDISTITPASLESPKEMNDFIHELSRLYLCNDENADTPSSEKSKKKRRKLDNGAADGMCSSSQTNLLHGELVKNTLQEINAMYQHYHSLFEWVDGPLVCSMKQGSMLLLDEMSLAEDAVLERLNSVLEPSRTLTLAEKGGEGPVCAHELSVGQGLSSEVKAHELFRIFATMNPGGGKCHLFLSSLCIL